MKNLLNDIVICLTILLGLLIALFFSISTVVFGKPYPPTLIGIFLGIPVAALTFRFLGGSDDASFSFGLLKLSGSAALLLGTSAFVRWGLERDRSKFETVSAYETRIAELEGSNTALSELSTKNKILLNTANRELQETRANQNKYNIEVIRKMPPDDGFISDLRKLIRAQEGPFKLAIRTMDARILVTTAVGDGLYTICADTYDKLYAGVAYPNPMIILSRAPDENSLPGIIKLERRGTIDDNLCRAADRDFDMQINCTAGQVLFPDIIRGCRGTTPIGGVVRGQRVRIGALPQ